MPIALFKDRSDDSSADGNTIIRSRVVPAPL
jgi:hypothetical protein